MSVTQDEVGYGVRTVDVRDSDCARVFCTDVDCGLVALKANTGRVRPSIFETTNLVQINGFINVAHVKILKGDILKAKQFVWNSELAGGDLTWTYPVPPPTVEFGYGEPPKILILAPY